MTNFIKVAAAMLCCAKTSYAAKKRKKLSIQNCRLVRKHGTDPPA